MTPRQKELARQALGLPNDHKTSGRNSFRAEGGTRDYVEWTIMVKLGDAIYWRASQITTHGHVYRLTRAGAEAALDDGERLDPLDFETAAI